MEEKRLTENKFYYTLTYGCQMNENDTERINGQLEDLGYKPAEKMEDADIVIMNTCSVRQNAEEKVYGKIGEIKKLKDKNPRLLLGIAGCMAQEKKVQNFCLGTYYAGVQQVLHLLYCSLCKRQGNQPHHRRHLP